MNRLLIAAVAALSAANPLAAQSALETWQADPTAVIDGVDVSLADFKWVARPVVVFADSPLDPAFQTQLENLQSELEEVTERDIVMIVDTDPANRSDLRTELRPRGFTLVLLGKDGTVKHRKPFPWDMRELGRAIDKMPMRQREIDEGRGS